MADFQTAFILEAAAGRSYVSNAGSLAKAAKSSSVESGSLCNLVREIIIKHSLTFQHERLSNFGLIVRVQRRHHFMGSIESRLS